MCGRFPLWLGRLAQLSAADGRAPDLPRNPHIITFA